MRDLQRLGQIARADREAMFSRNPRWALYRGRVLCVALCQGAALHYIDGATGIKDFDVWTFFAAHPRRPYPDPALYRGNTSRDFGPSRFGRHPADDRRRFTGRRVDLLSDSIEAALGAAPRAGVQAWLSAARRGTPAHLARKAVVLIEPDPGVVLWEGN